MKKFKEPASSRYQISFLPPTLDEAVPQNALVRIISDTVDKLDCSELEAKYKGGGAPSYPPKMLLKILILAYVEGIRSSRLIEQRCQRDIYYMFLTERMFPDYRTICRFRRANEAAIKTLFCQTVILCQTAGLILLQHVAIDGTKIEANVSSKETYNRKRVEEAITYTTACIEAILQDADAQDTKEDAQQKDWKEPPPPSAATLTGDKQALVAKLQRRKARAEEAKKRMAEGLGSAAGATDLDSRLMKTAHSGNRPAYNAQAAVDDANQIIVAAFITQECTDGQQMPAVIAEIIQNTGCKPGCATADCGYLTVETLHGIEAAGVTGYIAEREEQKIKAEYVYDAEADTLTIPLTIPAPLSPQPAAKKGTAKEDVPGPKTVMGVLHFHGLRTKKGKTFRVYRHAETKRETWLSLDPKAEMELRKSMHTRMTSSEGKAIYSQRQQTVEPVFGHMKTVLNLKRFLLRGLAGARIEYLLACAVHNLKKYARAQIQAMVEPRQQSIVARAI